MNPIEIKPQEEMMKLILGQWISKPIAVAAQLGLADLLCDGPMPIDVLAQETDSHPSTLYRLLRALSCIGIFHERPDGRFELTPMAACLTSDALGPVAMMMHADWHERAWGSLLAGIKTGDAGFEQIHGMSAFEWLDEHPEAAQVYNAANAVKARTTHRAIVDAYDFTNIGSLADIGGGNGALLAEILKVNPGMRGLIAERRTVLPQAVDHIRNTGLASRCEAAACDFFEAVPPGFDAYLMSHILHDWDDAPCKTILDNCRDVMAPGARLLIVESIVPEGNQFSIAKLLDLEVFVMGGGRERTRTEFANLFAASRLELTRIVPTDNDMAILELVPSAS